MFFPKMPHPHDGVRVRLCRERRCLDNLNYARQIWLVKPIINSTFLNIREEGISGIRRASVLALKTELWTGTRTTDK